jgi:hypothetical protein
MTRIEIIFMSYDVFKTSFIRENEKLRHRLVAIFSDTGEYRLCPYKH